MPKRLYTEEDLHTRISSVAHNFNNLLTVVLGQSSLARAKSTAGSPALVHLDRAISACLQGRALAEQVLAYPKEGEVAPNRVSWNASIYKELPPESHKDTILVVDDEAALREVLAEAVETAGLHVLTAEDGRQGVETFRIHQQTIALIVLDMQMPIMNGVEAAKELWKLEPSLPLILTSGYFEQRLIDDLVQHPAAVFLPKPYTIDTFLTMLEHRLQVRNVQSA